MQLAAKPIVVQFTLHKLTDTPGQSTPQKPERFEAWAANVTGDLFQRTVYNTAGEKRGTVSFWMSSRAAELYDAAVNAAMFPPDAPGRHHNYEVAVFA